MRFSIFSFPAVLLRWVWAQAMDLGVGLVQLTPDERRALRAEYNWKHLVERCLQRSLDMVEVFWNHRRTDI